MLRPTARALLTGCACSGARAAPAAAPPALFLAPGLCNAAYRASARDERRHSERALHCRRMDHDRGHQRDIVRRAFLEFLLNAPAARDCLAQHKHLKALVDAVTSGTMDALAAQQKQQSPVARNAAAILNMLSTWAGKHAEVRADRGVSLSHSAACIEGRHVCTTRVARETTCVPGPCAV